VRRNVYINYPISQRFGWGVYGLNLVLAWASDPDVSPICTRPFDSNAFAADPYRRHLLGRFLQETALLEAQLQPHAHKDANIAGPVLTYLEWDFLRKKSFHQVTLSGEPTIGVVFFETANLHPVCIDRAKTYPQIVTGSTWNEQILRAGGVTRVRTVLQGIDPTLFHVAPRSSFARDRFMVFSGGKLERRKGQDLALAAFAKFAKTRPDALLVTAWHGLVPELAKSLDESGAAPPVLFKPDGTVDVRGWAKAAGVADNQIIDLGVVPNPLLPPILRDMDAAIFPNRAEGGTNLVAMECMACGVPSILSRNTGHLDLIADDNCYALTSQGALEGKEAGFGEVDGWGESDVDEIVEALERIYADREAARATGLAGAETLKRLTWAETARQMKEIVLGTPKTAP
jgi:glycosyltransferase involved in cell wall biosynthesis